MSPNRGILHKVVFNPKLLNNPLGTRSLINLDFLQSNTAHLIKELLFIYLSLQPSGFYFLYFFCTPNNKITLLYM